MLTDFQNSFALGLSSDCITKLSLKIPPHLECVATLQSVISNGIDQWRRCFRACIPTTGGHFDYSVWHISQNVVNSK